MSNHVFSQLGSSKNYLGIMAGRIMDNLDQILQMQNHFV